MHSAGRGEEIQEALNLTPKTEQKTVQCEILI